MLAESTNPRSMTANTFKLCSSQFLVLPACRMTQGRKLGRRKHRHSSTHAGRATSRTSSPRARCPLGLASRLWTRPVASDSRRRPLAHPLIGVERAERGRHTCSATQAGARQDKPRRARPPMLAQCPCSRRHGRLGAGLALCHRGADGGWGAKAYICIELSWRPLPLKPAAMLEHTVRSQLSCHPYLRNVSLDTCPKQYDTGCTGTSRTT